jgi:hypothetical protein
VQKAIVIRASLTDDAGQSWSVEVDPMGRSAPNPLRALLADGWRVVQTCPMPSELDSCCLVILEKPDRIETEISDQPLADWNSSSDWLRLQSAAAPAKGGNPQWDGHSISLKIFGFGPKDVESN